MQTLSIKPLTPVAGDAVPPRASTRGGLASLSLAVLLSSLGTSAANVALPTLAADFHASFARVQWVVLAYLLGITVLIVGVGRLGDMVGPRRLLVAGLVLFTLASGLCGSAPTLGWLIAARAAQGAGAAAMMALAMALVGASVPKANTGGAMGLLGTMSAVGTALGPSLGGLLLAAAGWRAIFWANAVPGLGALWLAHRSLPADQEKRNGEPARLDWLGTLCLALALGAYALALTLGRGRFGAFNAALLAAAAIGLGLFAVVEKRAEAPLVRLEMLRDAGLRAGLAMSALVSTVIMATLVVGPFYLTRALGLDAARVGLVLSAGPLVSALTGVPAGRRVDRFGAQPMTVVGLLGMVGGCVALAALPPGVGLAGYLVPMVIITSGYALFQAANNTAVMAGLAPGQRGVVSGLLNLSRNLGLITGAAAMGAIFAAASGHADLGTAPREAVAMGRRVTFGCAAGLIVLALGFALRRRVARR